LGVKVANRQSRLGICAIQVGQLGQAIGGYAADNRGLMVSCSIVAGSTSWRTLLRNFLGAGTFACPGQDLDAPGVMTGYGLNPFLAWTPAGGDTTHTNWAQRGASGWPSAARDFKLVGIGVLPAGQRIILGDAMRHHFGLPPSIGTPDPRPSTQDSVAGGTDTVAYQAMRNSKAPLRHAGSVNGLFVDLHVERLKWEEMQFGIWGQ
jgi:prepilin-type processing-associated H-X9-DG protein